MPSRRMNSRGATLWGKELAEARLAEKRRERAIESIRSAERARRANGRAPAAYDEREESLTEPGILFRFNFADGSSEVVTVSEEEIAAEIAAALAKGGAR